MLACAAAFFMFFSLHGCGRTLPQNLDALFAAWYLNPDTRTAKSLYECNLSARQFDSLAQHARPAESVNGPQVTMLVDSLGVRYALGILPPVSFSRDSLYPLIIYLHGGIGTHLNIKGEKAYEMLAPLTDSLKLFIASPSANRAAPWWGPVGLYRILQAVRYMTLLYPIDPDRIVLAGVSDGATGCWAAANAMYAPFAGFIAVSGFGGLLPRFGIPLAPSNLQRRPIYNVNAGGDHLYPISEVNKFLDWCESEGIGVRRKVYENEKHGFDYRMSEMSTIAQLIRSWRKPHDGSVSLTLSGRGPFSGDNILDVAPAPSQGSRPPFVAGSWHGDTLYVQTRGIRSADFFFTGVTSPYIIVSYNGTVSRVKKLKYDAKLYMQAIQHECMPAVPDYSVYRVDFK